MAIVRQLETWDPSPLFRDNNFENSRQFVQLAPCIFVRQAARASAARTAINSLSSRLQKPALKGTLYGSPEACQVPSTETRDFRQPNDADANVDPLNSFAL